MRCIRTDTGRGDPDIRDVSKLTPEGVTQINEMYQIDTGRGDPDERDVSKLTPEEVTQIYEMYQN